jgi:putative tricarboxylic transport membrane protein
MAGKLRALAISAPERQAGALAAIPTWKEQGIDAVFDNWRGVAAPKGLSAEQLAFWDHTFAKLAQTDEWRLERDRREWAGNHRGANAFRTHLDEEYRKVQGTLVDIGVVKK